MQATAFDDAERELWQHHERVVARPEWFASEGGTTALVAVLHHNQLYLANVGDCRAVLGRSGLALSVCLPACLSVSVCLSVCITCLILNLLSYRCASKAGCQYALNTHTVLH